MGNAPSDHRQAAAAEAVGSGAAPGAMGAPPSNTAPCNCNESHTIALLRSGVDTLQLSYRGELQGEQAVRLRELKELARSKHLRENDRAQIELNGRPFQVLSKGFGLFKYVLTDRWYRISLSDGQGSLPIAFVQLGSDPLTQYGVRSVEKALRTILSELCHISDGPYISRLDICVDFATRFDFESVQMQQWVTRVKKYSSHAENHQFTGVTLGLGGNVAFRLYDKRQQIRVVDKMWFEDLWLDCGWDGETPVWRAEFEIKRDVLAQFDAVKLNDTDTLCAQLWPYLTEEWLRLAIPSESDQTRKPPRGSGQSEWTAEAYNRALRVLDPA